MKTSTSLFKSNLTDHYIDNDQLNNENMIERMNIKGFHVIYLINVSDVLFKYIAIIEDKPYA
jgi:hypothetical protein